MNKKISAYLKINKVLTLATSINDIPYCANCYYAWDESNNRLYFLSDKTTRHVSEAAQNLHIAGTITTDAKSIAKLQGIQFTGKFIIPNEEEQAGFYRIYYNKFPFAKVKPSPIWGIALEFIKMTDNTLGFGTKHFWEKD